MLHDVVMHIVAKVTMVYYTKPMTYIRHRYYIIISEVVKNPSSLGVAVGHCVLLMANTQGCAVLLR